MTESNKNKTIVAAFLEGDRNQIQQTLTELRPVIWSLVQKWGGTQADVRDVMQDCIAELIFKYRRQPDYVIKSKFTTFMYGLCVNILRRKWEKKGKDLTHNSLDTDDEILRETITDKEAEQIDKTLEYTEKNRLIRRIFGQLSEGCRIIIGLRFVEQKSHKQIVELLGFSSVNYSKKRLSNCNGKLQELIQKKRLLRRHSGKSKGFV